MREGSSLDEWRVTYINTHENIADLLMKNLPSGEKRMKFCKALLHYLSPIGENDGITDAAAIKVLPEDWIAAIISAVEFHESSQ